VSRLRSLSTGAWIAIGLIVGSILAPATAVAATSLVGIVGQNGVRAGVTSAGQLRTVEAAPYSFQEYARNGVVSGSCSVITASVGTTKAYIAKQIVFDVYATDTPPTPGDYIALYTDASCATQPIAMVTPASVNAWTYPLDPGFGIKAGGGLYAEAFGNVEANVTVYGYTVGVNDVPATTPIATPTP
jgi:hypothetical protein